MVTNLSQVGAPLHVDESPSAVDKKMVAKVASYGQIIKRWERMKMKSCPNSEWCI